MGPIERLRKITRVRPGIGTEPHAMIAAIGLEVAEGEPLIISVDQAASANKDQGLIYYADIEGRRIYFRHAHGPDKKLYLEPTDEAEKLGALLSLPHC